MAQEAVAPLTTNRKCFAAFFIVFVISNFSMIYARELQHVSELYRAAGTEVNKPFSSICNCKWAREKASLFKVLRNNNVIRPAVSKVPYS